MADGIQCSEPIELENWQQMEPVRKRESWQWTANHTKAHFHILAISDNFGHEWAHLIFYQTFWPFSHLCLKYRPFWVYIKDFSKGINREDKRTKSFSAWFLFLLFLRNRFFSPNAICFHLKFFVFFCFPLLSLGSRKSNRFVTWLCGRVGQKHDCYLCFPLWKHQQ